MEIPVLTLRVPERFLALSSRAVPGGSSKEQSRLRRDFYPLLAYPARDGRAITEISRAQTAPRAVLRRLQRCIQATPRGFRRRLPVFSQAITLCSDGFCTYLCLRFYSSAYQ